MCQTLAVGWLLRIGHFVAVDNQLNGCGSVQENLRELQKNLMKSFCYGHMCVYMTTFTHIEMQALRLSL